MERDTREKALQEEVASYQKAISAQKQVFEEKQRNSTALIVGLQAKVAALEQSCKEVSSRNSAFVSEHQALQALDADHRTRVTAFEKHIRTLESSYATLKEQYERLFEEESRTKGQLGVARAALAQMQDANLSLQRSPSKVGIDEGASSAHRESLIEMEKSMAKLKADLGVANSRYEKVKIRESETRDTMALEIAKLREALDLEREKSRSAEIVHSFFIHEIIT